MRWHAVCGPPTGCMRVSAIAATGILLLAACSNETGQFGETGEASPTESPTPTAAPTPTPEPTTTATPTAEPTPTPTPFGAAVFDDPDSCVNEELGYRVAFPESWYYNTAYADFPACMFFHPEHFEVEGDEPPETAIDFREHEGLAVGILGIYTMTLNEETEVDGRPAVRWEYEGLEGNPNADERFYNYTFFTTDDYSETGPSVTASVSGTAHPDYEENKAVLDQMMQTMEITAP